MRVLHIINSLEAGGAQKLLADMLPLISREADTNVSIAVFRTTNSDNERILSEAGINIINIDAPALSLKSFMRLLTVIKKADIVHVHLFAANYMTAIANIFAGKPLIFTEHSTHNKRRNHKWLRPIEKFIYSRFHSIACISDQTAETLLHWIGHKIGDKRITVIPNGINLTKYQNAMQKSPEEMFGKPGIPLLMVSRFVESKDQPTVIRALKHIDNPDTFLVFVGDGPLKGRCEQIANESGLRDRIIFLGTRNDVPEIIKASKIGIQSSNWEGFGLTAVEMMAGGIPVIASDVDGLKQVVEDAGLSFRKGDSKDLADKIGRIVSDQAMYQRLSCEGIQKSQTYSIYFTAEKYVALYRSLTGL